MHQARHRPDGSSWLIRPRSLAALAVAGAGLAAAIWLPGIGGVASASEMRPAFADEFNGGPGTAIDMTKWNIDGGAQNATEDGSGHLVVTSLLRTRQAFTEAYGHAEASIQVNRAAGAWRAFGVLDQFGRPIPGRLQMLKGGADPTSGDSFHTYAIDWAPQAIVWSVDGKPTLRLLPAAASQGIVPVLDFAADGTKPARLTVDFVHVSVWGRAGSMPPGARASSWPGTLPSGWPTGWPTGWPSPSATTDAPPTGTPTSGSPSPSDSSAAPPTAVSPSGAPTTSAPTAKPWKAFTDYAVGDLVTYKGVTYRVKEAHTSLPGWEPTALPNLFEKV